MDFRNDVTGDLAHGHNIGTNASGEQLYSWPEGWTPTVPCWADEEGHAIAIDPALVSLVEEKAGATAALFVEEFGEAWNPETDGDWDAEAFGLEEWGDRAEDVRTFHESLWPHWLHVFEAETERLAAERAA